MRIEPATADDLPDLAGLLVDAVDGGASVGFLAGLTTKEAVAFWREQEALRRGRWLLLLDTETGSTAQSLYARLGWQVLGVLDDHAVRPEGGLAPTTFLFKRLNA